MMRRSILAMILPALLTACVPSSAEQPDENMSWAYPVSPQTSVTAPARDANALLTIPGARKRFTRAEVTNLFSAPDWKPGDHPPMPPVVAYGRKPDVMACAYCHLPTGDGRPENAPLAGLPRGYFIEQMHLFRDGHRTSSVPGRAPGVNMVHTAKGMTEAEIIAAADYFSALKHRSYIRITETATVPRSITKGWIYSRDPAGGTEPLGQRVLEMPQDFERFERRDPAIPYNTYVPTGSVKSGAALARNWVGSTLACAACHGHDLRGNGDIPPLAGRSPTYIARQLQDFKTGARTGGQAEQMAPVVAPMQASDMIALSAYLGSLRP